jgi:hypothetical protein
VIGESVKLTHFASDQHFVSSRTKSMYGPGGATAGSVGMVASITLSATIVASSVTNRCVMLLECVTALGRIRTAENVAPWLKLPFVIVIVRGVVAAAAYVMVAGATLPISGRDSFTRTELPPSDSSSSGGKNSS